MTVSKGVVAFRKAPSKSVSQPASHTAESRVAAGLAMNAAALRLALLVRKGRDVAVPRRALAGLIEDMEAWAGELERADSEVSVLMRGIAA